MFSIYLILLLTVVISNCKKHLKVRLTRAFPGEYSIYDSTVFQLYQQ